MAERPRNDDEGVVPGEVTVPPWLRTGPSPDPATPTVPDEAPREAGPSERTRHGRAPAGADPTGVAPSRITLGARPREEEPAASAPRADDLSTLPLRPEEPRDRTTGGAPAQGGAAAWTGAPATGAPATGGGPVAGPTTAGPASAAGPTTAGPTTAADPTVRRPSSVARVAVWALGGLAVVAGTAVIGFVVTRGMIDPAGDVAVADGGTCAAVEEADRVVGAGPGSLETPAGTVLAFDHAYYVERSAEKAFEAVAESSRMSEERLRTEGIDKVPEGTTHCAEIRTVSPTLLDVTLTEYRPGGETIPIRQRVRVEEDAADGTWGIVSITPAG